MSARRNLVLAAIAAFLAWSAAAHAQTCTPSQEMQAKLAGAKDAATLNDLGDQFAQKQQYACAVQAFATSLQTDPQQPGLRHVVFLFGASLYYSGDTKEAIAAFQEAERIGYRDVHLHMLLAAALDEQQAAAQAEEQWRKALEYEPESTVALDALSSDQLAAEQFKDVIDLLEAPRVLPQRSVAQVLNLAAAYNGLNRPDDAVKTLEDGLNTWPASKEIAQKLTALLTSLHRDAEAAMVRNIADGSDSANP